MKNALWNNCATLILFSLTLQAPAITFNGDATLAPDDKRFDGEPLIVSNCVLTVDGPHAFASLQLLGGAVLTHTHVPDGFLPGELAITNEPYSLHLTNPTALLSPGIVPSSIVVKNAENSSVYTNQIDYTISLGTNGIVSLQLVPGSSIPQDSTVLVNYVSSGLVIPTGLNLSVAGDTWISAGARINVDGKGFAGGQGPGAGRSAPGYLVPISGSGAGHGGFGGPSATGAVPGSGYGSALQPITKGSGGGSGLSGLPGGSGGGAVKLSVGNMLRLDGTITARGANGSESRTGGGSGGSIWLKAGLLVGSGSINADGGAGEPVEGGGGGGGRIALDAAQMAFNGSMQARGGQGYANGGAGSIYSRSGESRGKLTYDNGGSTGASPLLNFGQFDLVIAEGSDLTWTADGGVASLLVQSNAWLTLSNRVIVAASNVTIHAGGAIRANGFGYSAGQGPGAGKTASVLGTSVGLIGGGAGSGGYGGSGATYSSTRTGGSGYGLYSSPMEPGSGGGDTYYSLAGGSKGGGTIRMLVLGMLLCDGWISANGMDGLNPRSGGGSGGSIWLDVGSLAGSGRIAAIGGNGDGSGMYSGGGGGGGRIAITHKLNLFFGTMSARGGDGHVIGGAGTIYTKAQSEPYGMLLADNEDQIGAPTSLSDGTPPGGLVIRRGAAAELPFTRLTSLSVGRGGLLTMPPGTPARISVTGDLVVERGGVICADGRYTQGRGSGSGRVAGSLSGGGGHGGLGGSPEGVQPSLGGASYDDPFNPTMPGSPGGHMAGGPGGGFLSLSVANRLTIDGVISANGEPSTNSLVGGGGSGGTIALQAGVLTGSGNVLCDGGSGSVSGGGGGGGRISLVFNTNAFVGVLNARGGEGAMTGGAGTISMSSRADWRKDLIVDNGGRVGTNTPIPNFTAGRVFFRNGARPRLMTEPKVTCTDLILASNAWISGTTVRLSSSNLTVDADSGMTTEGGGYTSGTGPGAGENQLMGSGGAGHGGRGAPGKGSMGKYGSTYDNVENPTLVGSGGGSAGERQGGTGGGLVHLTVTRSLTMDGTIIASGTGASSTNSGGGSGGSINVTAGSLSGSGVFVADGAKGLNYGGGGAGGRIAVASDLNVFQGRYSAKGGTGFGTGGAGTICLKPKGSAGVIHIDNGGQSGAPTVLGDWAKSQLMLNNGAVGLISGPTALMNLTIGENGSLVFTDTSILTVNGNVTIAAGGSINADQTGYPSSQGQGTGGIQSGGAGYGGAGGSGKPGAQQLSNLGGRTYGSVTAAYDRGSGGGGVTNYATSTGGVGGTGGGAARLAVTGTLRVDGAISANGGNAAGALAGGGSGGSVHVRAGAILGSGLISANGGNGTALGGGGGGGRIVLLSDQDAFSGKVIAFGGDGFSAGGAGTIYRSRTESNAGTVYVDNGGRLGTNTSTVGMLASDLEVANGGIAAVYQKLSLANVFVRSNGWISASQVVFQASSLTIAKGGGVLSDETGHAGGRGPGVGRVFQTQTGVISGGGGYGGYGGWGALQSSSSVAQGGEGYGSMMAPIDLGSGGGGTQALGGAGGGAIDIILSGSLANEGVISAGGAIGQSSGGGGGSGGSIRIQCSVLTGTGIIRADGGDGNGSGGPGGGGRVAIVCGQDSYSGRITALGGAGASSFGGAGTIYRGTKNLSLAPGVLVNNEGRVGTNTLLTTMITPYDLSILNGGRALSTSSSLTLSNLLVSAGGTLTCRQSTNCNVVVLGNAVVERSALVTVDGLGYPMASGPGAGLSTNSAGSGGGHGGRGGASAYQPGGAAYGTLDQPNHLGSGGGAGADDSTRYGSEGGGAIRLFVGGQLLLNGQLSANGNDALNDDAGGGGGGSVLLLANVLTGNGAITANGGAGNLYKGGGGGGGRVAIYAPVNLFAGTVAVQGGSGFAPGQKGTIFFSEAAWPKIEGRVVNIHNQPVANLPLQASAAGLYVSALTAVDGSYSLSIPPLSDPTVCLADPNLRATPAFRTYEALAGSVSGQDYLLITEAELPSLKSTTEGSDLALGWTGRPGTTYYIDCSTNLVDWAPYGTGITCSIADQPLRITLPREEPYRFFRLRAEY